MRLDRRCEFRFGGSEREDLDGPVQEEAAGSPWATGFQIPANRLGIVGGEDRPDEGRVKADKVSGTDFGHISRRKPFSVPDTFSTAFQYALGSYRSASSQVTFRVGQPFQADFRLESLTYVVRN